MFVTQKCLSRRAMLKGAGATIALPLLDAMLPAGRSVVAAVAAPKTRLVCIEMVHGAAGSTDAAVGRDFDLAPTSLSALTPFRDYLTIVSNTDVANAEPFEAREIGGDHFRSSAVFLTQAHPKRAEGSAIRAGVSLDQLHAQRFGQTTPLPSLQLSIEAVDQGGGCAYGYSCAYVDTISWASPTRPLPMIRDPRVALRFAHGRLSSPQPQAGAVLSGGPRRRAAQGRPSPQSREPNATGKRDARLAPRARAWRSRRVRRQSRTVRAEHTMRRY
jgi:hypothetical protein